MACKWNGQREGEEMEGGDGCAACGRLPRMLALQCQECGMCVRHKSPMYVSWAKCVCVSYVFRSVHCLYLPSCVYRGSVSSKNNMTRGSVGDGKAEGAAACWCCVQLFVFNYVWTRCHFCAAQDLLMCIPSLPSSQAERSVVPSEPLLFPHSEKFMLRNINYETSYSKERKTSPKYNDKKNVCVSRNFLFDVFTKLNLKFQEKLHLRFN